MQRRSFLKLLGLGAATAVVAPHLVPDMLAGLGRTSLAPITVTPLGSYIRISNELLMDSAPTLDAIIRRDLSRLLAMQQDRLFLSGVT